MNFHTILLKDCSFIVTQNHRREIIQEGSILIKDGVINDVLKRPSSSGHADLTINGKNKLVLPGLIDTHTHLSANLFTAFTDNLSYRKVEESRISALEESLSGEQCYYGALLGCLEMIKSGTTCFLDISSSPDYIAKAVKESGLRAYIAPILTDSIDEGEVVKQISKIRRMRDIRVRNAISSPSPHLCLEGTLVKIKEIADREKIPFTFHLAETRQEQVGFENKYRMREIEYLDKIGCLSSNLLAAHTVWLTRREVTLLAQRKVKVVHCPVSNMRWAVGGVAPIPEMLEDGITVSLGSDGIVGSGCLDLFETMKIGAMIHKAYRWDPTILPPQTVVDMATIGGTAALDQSSKMGSISKGKEADLILLDLNSPTLKPLHRMNVVSKLVYSAKGGNVDTVIVGGELLMHKKRLVSLNESEIYSRVEESFEQDIEDTA